MSSDKCSANGDDKSSPTKQMQQPTTIVQDTIHRYQGTRMTPSIITTINNTSPSPHVDGSTAPINSNTIQSQGRNSRRNEPYESYIEDSFVGHWEHEDDLDEYHEDFDLESQDERSVGKSDLQHPSTIEFDFDSFGPESMIYTPSSSSQAKNTATSGASSSVNTSRPPTLVEVSREAEKAEEVKRKEEAKANNLSNQPQIEETDATRSPTNSVDHIADSRYLNNHPPQYYLVDPAQIDLKVIEPYKKVISHAGYCHHFDSSFPKAAPGDSVPAVIVFSACYLPDRSRSDYNYVMDHLFLYVLSSLHELIADDYILIYLHNTQPLVQASSKVTGNGQVTSAGSPGETQNLNNLPTFTWIKRCYQMIDRRLRKNLKILYLVKSTFWLKTIVMMCRPFISAKFSKKLRFVENMVELRKCIPVDELILPASATSF